MRELRLVLLGLAAVIALLLGATFLMRAFKMAAPAPPPPTREEAPPAPTPTPPAQTETTAGAPSEQTAKARAAVERAVADSTDYTRFFDRLRLVFASDYDAILNEVAASNANVAEVNADKVMLDALAAMRRAHGALASSASDEALGQLFALQTQEVQALSERDPHLCILFAAGGRADGFLAFMADHRGLVADAAIAALDAMNSGRMDQIKRSSPSDADFQSLDRALVEAGLTRPEIAAILDDTPANPPIGDDAMCKAQQTYMKTVAAMPTEIRARLYAFWAAQMAKS